MKSGCTLIVNCGLGQIAPILFQKAEVDQCVYVTGISAERTGIGAERAGRVPT